MSEPITDSEQAERLVQEFVAAAKHEYVVRYNIPAQHRAVRVESRIVRQLDALRPDGRNALTVLLDHRDIYVRSRAACFLLDTLPERAAAVLRHIEDNYYGSAAVKAHMALVMWESEQATARAKKP